MINWLDFKSIKRTVTLESVLRHYQIKLRRSGKDQYRGCCPIHRGDGRDAFHVNLARNVSTASRVAPEEPYWTSLLRWRVAPCSMQRKGYSP